MLDILQNDKTICDDPNGIKIVEYLQNPINIADWMNVHCVGKVIVEEAVNFLRSAWNRHIEYMVKVGEYYKQQTEMLYALGYLITAFDTQIIDEAITYRQNTYNTPTYKWCARKVSTSSGNVSLCTKTPKDGYLSCPEHRPTFEPYLQSNRNIQKIIPLLLSDVLKSEKVMLDNIYHGIIPDPDIHKMSAKKCKYLLNKYYFPLFDFLDSDLFESWLCDPNDSQLAKCIVVINSFICIWNHRMKFTERVKNTLEPGLCIPFLLYHPDFRIKFAKNMVSIGREALMNLTTEHLEFKTQPKFVERLD
eukprot:912573_1